MEKNIGAIFFYIFLTIFVTLTYLYNNNLLSFLPKDSDSVKNNQTITKYKAKQFVENFSKKYNNSAVEIASFEQQERWKGDYVVDDVNYFEGKSSFTFASDKNQLSTLELQKSSSLNLQKVGLIKILIYSLNAENSNNTISLLLTLGSSSNTFKYEITNINPGWNIIRMTKNNFVSTQKTAAALNEWGKINRIRLDLLSRPNTKAELTVDRLWGEKDEAYQEDFTANSSNIISLKNFENNSYINFWNFSGANAIIKKVTGVSDFNYIVKIIPEKSGSFGISARTDLQTGYGYFFELGGIGLKTWELYKVGEPNDSNNPVTSLANGTLDGIDIEKNQPLWLKIITNKEKIQCYISKDGINFIKVTEKMDGEIKSGGIGLISKGGSFLVETVEFNQ